MSFAYKLYLFLIIAIKFYKVRFLFLLSIYHLSHIFVIKSLVIFFI